LHRDHLLQPATDLLQPGDRTMNAWRWSDHRSGCGGSILV
jgi:hypothetical protein